MLTLEIDKRRAGLARENFAAVGLEGVIELREGDALEIIPTLEGPFDFVFIDAWKPDYIRYFQMLYSKLRPGGALVAHNVTSHREQMKDFLETIQNHPDLQTRIDRRSHRGLEALHGRQPGVRHFPGCPRL